MKTEDFKFSISALIRRTISYYWRSNVAVAMGVCVAAAVLVGSLLVGDSVKGSLRELALERLGRTDYALVAPGFFREELANDLLSRHIDGTINNLSEHNLAVPAIILNGTARHASTGLVTPRVTILGVTDEFWHLGQSEPTTKLNGRNVILNQNLAEDIGAVEGDAVLLTVGRRGPVSTDTVFGHRDREHTIRSLRVIVRGIIPGRGIGSFSLRNDQPRPRNLYISLSWLQQQLKQKGQANTILVSSRDNVGAIERNLASVIKLEDYGLRLVTNTKHGYISLESRQLLLSPSLMEAVRKSAKESSLHFKITSVYLANSLSLIKGEALRSKVPYSIVAGLDTKSRPPLGPLPMTDGNAPPALGADDILLNAWTANDLGGRVGDTIEIAYYVAGKRGQLLTKKRRFTLRGIVAMEGAALDPGLVPRYEGITDAKTMQEWDPPFPIDLKQIHPKDEEYWEKYRTTPKAFVSIETARSFWQPTPTQQGWITSVRLAPAKLGDLNLVARTFSQCLLRHLSPSNFGLTFRPVKTEALAAAKGSTDFGVLFLSMSMFLVVSAAALVGLLLRLTIERRANQYGILSATGFTPRYAQRVLISEGMLLALIGTVIGIPLGVGYAWLIIYALRTWWAGAVGEFVFALHVHATSLVVGSVATLVVAAVTIWWSARILGRVRTLTLLAGWRALAAMPRAVTKRRAIQIGIATLSLAVVLLVISVGFDLLSPTGAFFGIGSALLVGILALFCAQLQSPQGQVEVKTISLSRLAWRGASRQWLRSMLTVGLLACASFIIVTVAANRKDLARLDTTQPSSGAGGFNLMARSDLPIYYDLNSEEGREQLGFSREDSRALTGSQIIPLRMTEGDDVSCLNLQRSATPRLLGVPHELIEHGGFTFAKVLPVNAHGGERVNSWMLLEKEIQGQGLSPRVSSSSAMTRKSPSQEERSERVIPAFADAATAQWILHLGLGDEIEMPTKDGRKVRLRIVGMLSNSIFASEFLIAEEQFRRYFGSDSGYRFFLIKTASERRAVSVLRKNLGELGFDVIRTADMLARFARVQNTYLETFQTLGSLGLFLGTFGIVTVLLRGVVERRSELAMMLALGFRRGRIVGMIVLENGLLLILGVITGTVAALVAVAPHLISTLADVKWTSLATALLLCVVVGLVSCAAAASSSVRSELLSALRSE